jgi:hypothetical protein
VVGWENPRRSRWALFGRADRNFPSGCDCHPESPDRATWERASLTIDAGTVPIAARCLDCGYALRGLGGRRCPECGRPFDPAMPATMRLAGRPPGVVRRWWIGQVGTPAVAWAVATFLAAVMLGGAFDPRADRSPLGPLSVIGVASLIGTAVREPLRRAQVNAHPALARSRRLSRAARRAIAVALLGISLAAGVGIHVCPHGTQIGVFGVGLAYSHVGGPCRNAVPDLEVTHVGGDWYLWRG